MTERPVIFWFRDDLRLADNPGLASAHATGKPLIPLFILDEESREARAMGGASKWWLDKSLRALASRLAAKGAQLVLRKGPADDVLAGLVKETGADAVCWSRRYGAARAIDERIKATLKSKGLRVESFSASLLAEPFEMKTGSGGDYKVFTPFWKSLQAGLSVPPPAPEPRRFTPAAAIRSDSLEEWQLHPTAPDWSAGLAAMWMPGELGAQKRLDTFLRSANGYAAGRDRPDLEHTSRLSPHLRFGEIGPRQVWRRAVVARETEGVSEKDVQKFLSELAWREFSYHLLYHDPAMTRLSWRRRFEDVAWRSGSAKEILAWQQGRTGFPIVDAGMRELWSTGYMHNRVRMIAASFLTKDLLVHWRRGEQWFWDTLVDADEASNANGWQWTAGTGADAAPYFRVFNPFLQGEKFDPQGDYVRRWVPELRSMPAKWIHRPHEAPASVWAGLGMKPSGSYVPPIVDHDFARKRAIAAYKLPTDQEAST